MSDHRDLQQKIVEIFESEPFETLVDVQCGDGRFLEELSRMLPGVRLVGVDDDPRNVEGPVVFAPRDRPDARNVALQQIGVTAERNALFVYRTSCASMDDLAATLGESRLLIVDADLTAAAGAGLFLECGDRSRRFPYVFAKRDFVIRPAAEGDLDRLCELEALCWQHTRTPREQLLARLQTHPHGQLVLAKNDEVLGVIYSQRIASVDALLPRTAADVHELHDPSGPIVQLLALNVDPRVQNAGYGDQLLEFMLQRCSLTDGVEQVAGVTLCKRFDAARDASFEDYIRRQGSGQDPVLAFHWAHGAEIVRAIPNYRPEDQANLHNGVLIAYDVRNRPDRRKRISDAAPAPLDREQIARFVHAAAAQLLGIAESDLDPDRPVMEMGLDSADLLKLQRICEEHFAVQLPAAFFFEHSTIRKAITYLAAGVAPPPPAGQLPTRTTSTDIAIIGMSCKLPGGIETPDDLWRVLAAGECVIDSYPRRRGAWPGATEYPAIDQGGFVRDADAFDAAFFRVSPAEAQITDPQQRMLMQLAWACLEDAGVLPAALKGSGTGVFVGASNFDYSRLVQDVGLEVEAFHGVGSSLAILANRISYFFDLSGPSLVVDTACSSSLVALHAAVQSLRSGECGAALVGGVNLICHPHLSIAYQKAGMLSPDGRCKVFDATADGYVRAEGAVVLLLEPVETAIREGHRIHAVIRGTATNHGGLAGGLTVPNPQKQKELLLAAWRDAGITAADLTYIEAHGTGTSLGDPIEVQGMQAAHAELAAEGTAPAVAIGSVKSNVGHLESAAGITGLLKVILALRHRQLPATVNFTRLNPKISLEGTPFAIQDRLREWAGERPRVAGVSSFGSGGANAHVVVEESAPVVRNADAGEEQLFVLSAANDERLRDYAGRVSDWLKVTSVSFADAIFTWQTGRTAMKQRLAIKAKDRVDLRDKLQRWLAGDGEDAEIWSGQAGKIDPVLARMWQTKWGRQLAELAVEERDLDAIAMLWTAGMEVDWRRFYAGRDPRPVSVPTYPFAKDRHWIDVVPSRRAIGVMHPLLHANTSDLSRQSYSATFTGAEFFLADHQVRLDGRNAQKVLPAVAYLEMTRAAVERALPAWPESTVLELRNTAWVQPIVVASATQVSITLAADDGDEIDYEISTGDAVHCQGRARLVPPPAAERVDLAPLAQASIDPADVYAAWARTGLVYGPAFRTITAIQHDGAQSLVRLRLDDASSELVLHPSVMDGAVQAAVGFADGWSQRFGELRLPFALESLRVLAPCTADMVACVRRASGEKLDVDLCDADGNVCVAMRGFSLRTVSAGVLLATPVWQDAELEPATIDYTQRIVERPSSADYGDCAVACFERIRSILQNKPEGKVLFQLAIPDDEEHALLAGLSGILKTAAIENPRFFGQIAIGLTDEQLDAETRQSVDTVIRYRDGVRQVLRWQEVTTAEEPVAFKRDGVYLITGGRGALGTLFADEIRAHGARVVLAGRSGDHQVDLENADDVRRLIARILDEHGRLDGILHCAGMIADAFIVNKDSAQFRKVLAPKVIGTQNLDDATRDLALDFFVLFSSVYGPHGNVGQADYAAANGFLDHFAAQRNRLVAAGQRRGRTRSIDWPLWQDGGMKMDAVAIERMQQSTGMVPMQTATGLHAFRRILALPHDQVLVAEGDVARIRRFAAEVWPRPSSAAVFAPSESSAAEDGRHHTLAEKTEELLRRQFSGVLKLPAHDIDPRAALKDYGIDSMLAMKLTNRLEETFGSLSKTLFFEYQTVRELTEYFVDQHAPQLSALFATDVPRVKASVPPPTAARRRRPSPRDAGGPPVKAEPIAIIGLSGRYPQAPDIEAYWTNLRDGKDCIVEVPPERWDWRRYFSEDRTTEGRHYSRWGGFIAGVDEFDPLFFSIAPKEAKFIDPQERLFLQHAWAAIEDAGYTRASLQVPHEQDLPGQVGVYAGVMWSEYQLFGTAARAEDVRMGFAGNPASIANRVSYVLNLHGPSMTVDTMCSSSLTAIHVACEDLRHGRTSLAIAGGVNVSVHPHKYLMLSVGQFISSDGHCQSFGEGGDGYIPGEGVGVVVLKRLSEAERDGDHIYGVIRGSALTHGGRTNGYTVPNPQAQASAIRRALTDAKVDPRHISYVEAHGTGTKLGDPIEIAALAKAFDVEDTGFCLVGSAKSNIGHCESAAGIAGLTKILLQMQHRQIVPSLHSAQLNPHIDFARTPFVVNQELRPWEPPVIDGRTLPRIAGISSFGAGGSNAHMIVEEYAAPVSQPLPVANVAIVLSARTPEQLQQKAIDLRAFVRSRADLDLVATAYTLQLGREAMEERLGFVAGSVEELLRKLDAFVRGEQDDLFIGQAKRNKDALSLFSTDADLKQAVDNWIADGKLSRLVDLWAKGLEIDWSRLYGEDRPRRVSLPAYPFARERYWIDVAQTAPAPIAVAPIAVAPPPQPVLMPAARSKPSIALTPLDAIAPLPVRPVAPKPVITLDAPVSSPVHASDRGDGTFVIEIAASRASDMIAPFLEALARVQQEPALKVLILDGIEYCFPHGDRRDYDEALQRKLFHALVSFPMPVIAVLPGDVIGAGFLAAALCDFLVCSEDAEYGYRDADGKVAALFTERFGAAQAREFLSAPTPSTGRQLRAHGWTCPIVPWTEVDAQAQTLASTLVTKSRDALRLLKEHLTRRVATLVDGLTGEVAIAIEDETRDLLALLETVESNDVAEIAAGPIVLQSTVVRACAHPEGIVVVTLEDREAKNLFSDALVAGVTEAFDHIRRSASYKAVVLIGYDSYFASGGTKETLLAIQQGTAKFTDVRIFQAALDCELPVIAAMQGHAIGAGWSMGMFADLVLLSEESHYVSPYMDYGFTPGAGATLSLAARMGHDLARESLFTAREYTGRELKERGVALRVLPRSEVLPAAMALARQIARAPRARLVALKQQLAAPLRQQLEEVYRRELAMHEQTFVGRADTRARIESRFQQEARVEPVSAPPVVVDADALRNVSATLKSLLAHELQIREASLHDDAQFVDLGLDSISGVTWVRKINEKYGTAIEATKIYAYPTLAQLSRYVKEEAEQHGTMPVAPPPPVVAPPPIAEERRLPAGRPAGILPAPPVVTPPPTRGSAPIAIIGMAGQFPQARNLDEFWQNIATGRNCITEVPPERWDPSAVYQPGDPKPGKSTSRWAGVIADYDRFDPLFFKISPTEAEHMDPQQRLFLEASWHAIEDAGYAARALSGTRTGVFAGCANGDYHQLSREHQLSAQGFTGSAMSILAARIAYLLNLQGPCVSIDTACSSSLVAIANACDSLTTGASDLALAGGVYVMVGPEMHIKTSQAGMLSPDGRCFTFDQRANGFVPGEGVGVVLLKRLSDAERDGDIVQAVIHGWGVNQDGKTNGITAPNPESQTRLAQDVYARFAIDPAAIQLVEAHGTGTKLGDPIEVDGLKKAFAKSTASAESCALGSVKSNIGHCLAAAGVAGLLKVVLALKERQLPPTINFERLNEHIDLNGTPFYVNDRLREWSSGASGRRAATSSFGFSGTNAHIVLGDHQPSAAVASAIRTVIVPLSARTPEQLQQKASDLLDFVLRRPSLDLAALACTLQIGREPMDERLGIVADSIEQLAQRLDAFARGESPVAGLHRGRIQRAAESTSVMSQDDDVKQTIVGRLVASGKLDQLAELWVSGLDVDWTMLHPDGKPRRITLPLYPFARERYWIDAAPRIAGTTSAAAHPLLHVNASDLDEHRYTSAFTGDEHFLADHRVRADKLLPGVAYLEMARAALQQTWPRQAETSVVELRDHVWLEPFAVAGPRRISISLVPSEGERVDYEIHSTEALHAQGQAVFTTRTAAQRIDVETLRGRMIRQRWEARDVYAICDRMGLHYGPAHQGVVTLDLGEKELLARLRLPAVVATNGHPYVLHPSVMDSALQASIGLLVDPQRVPSAPLVPFAVDSLRIHGPCTNEMLAWVREANGKIDVDLCDPDGNVAVQIRGFALRAAKGRFDDAFYENLIDDLVNRRVSIDEAVAVG